jgi:hypothetical protein
MVDERAQEERDQGVEGLEGLEALEDWRSGDLLGGDQGDAGLVRLIDEIADRQPPEPLPEPSAPSESEFACRSCHLIFACSCLADRVRMLCRDCAALVPDEGVPPYEAPPVHHVHHPCPACGALVKVPEREEVSCGFVCPSCRVHLIKRDGHLHMTWNHRDAVIMEGNP